MTFPGPAGAVARAAGLATLVAVVCPAPAAAAEAMRVVVRLAEGADHSVLARLRGQTSDLRMTLVAVETPPLEPALPEQIAAASALATRERGDVVVWLAYGTCEEGQAPSSSVMVMDVGDRSGDNLVARSIAGSPCEKVGEKAAAPAVASPLFEAAALAIRSALVAMSEAARPAPPPPPPPPPPVVVAPAPPPPALRPRLAALGLLALDGLTPAGQPGLGVRVGVGLRRLDVELAASSTLPTPVSDAFSTVSLSRSTVTAAVARRFPLRAGLVAVASAGVGVARVAYSTRARLPEVAAYRSGHHLSLLVAPELRLAFAPATWGGLGVTIGAGLDYLPGALTLAYERGGMVDTPRTLRRLQPRLFLGLEVGRQ